MAATCNVLFSVMDEGIVQAGARVSATLEEQNNCVVGSLCSRQETLGTTDSSGNCTLTLIQFAQFTVGGVYRIVWSRTRMERYCTIEG